MQKIKRSIREIYISKPTFRFLRISMLLICGMSLILLDRFLEARLIDPLVARHFYPPLCEYIIASIVISIAGAFLIEHSCRRRNI